MKNFFTKKKILILILFLAAGLRLYGLNWDQNQHLHPDERFLTMVETAIKIPNSFKDYLNPQVSPMSPYNKGYRFFVYGTFPLNLTKIMGEIINYRDYSNIHFVGRVLSALFDLGVVFLIYKIAAKIFNDKVGLVSAFLYSIMVLPIQLSHFFAVDTFLNFFLVISFYLLLKILNTKYLILNTSRLGLSFGLAIACKISALYFAPIIGLGFLFMFVKSFKEKKVLLFILASFFFILTSLLVFRLAQPQAFTTGNFLSLKINPQFIANLTELKSYNDPNSWSPPGIQWKKTLPIIFPLKNLILWGLGLPLGIIAAAAVPYAIISLIRLITKKKIFPLSLSSFGLFLIWLWVLGLFFYQGLQFTKTMRYFLPIYPFLAILSAKFLSEIFSLINRKYPKLFLIFDICILILLLIYSLSFMSIYTRPITRASASEWIYKNIPAASVLGNEHWDDPLPLSLPKQNSSMFRGEILELYNFDSPQKWEKINQQLNKINYIILSSNRLYGSISKVPEMYPQTAEYYKKLFNGSLGFEKVAEFTSYPCFPPFGGRHLFCFNDDNAEEAFTVYDHPKVTIFQRDKKANLLEGF
ncbi:hypothetical protein COS54_01885 [Candidatus Shapirobacteria bacterium CG03_land_8_20_14_0_80_39_12]|uniref:Glycosyltransferase RgtA/B/C/D-like domain-containing protein n=1 Tax=Candidatus Shapirobacteria bacterium CG03_land_8_20_14_0_80_39_12 TaxID=1974879 RepID=A0A2M7BD00_9BACT|nr:MAG: hypothetical protein COS54_01885 [Candidatus Shapirobacteria bacterium CG03_land_8_20_14_0_80_39_12]